MSEDGDRGSEAWPLWVPVARIPSLAAPALRIHDSDGRMLPRLTRHETARLVAPGLYRMLKTLLSATPHAPKDHGVGSLLHQIDESRWHIEAAIYSLMTERGIPFHEDYSSPRSGYVFGPSAEYKQFALEVLRSNEELLRPFYQLLEVAVYDQLVVVGIDEVNREHLLTFENSAPHQHSSHGPIRRITDGRASSFRVEYHSMVPETVNSYHLAIEVEEDLVVNPLILTTRAESVLADRLQRDLVDVANRMSQLNPPPPSTPAWKYLELEGQSTLKKLAELLRRRRWEAQEAGRVVDEDGLRNIAALSVAAVDGMSSVSASGDVRASVLVKPEVTPERIKAAAAEVSDMELAISFTEASDPPSNAAHCYWRRTPSLATASQPVPVSARFVVRDTTHERPGILRLYVGAICLLIWATASFMARGLWPIVPIRVTPTESDAIVAVLLLVPGFLYGQLRWPPSGSIAATLRTTTHVVAVISLTMAVVLSMAIAAASSPYLLNVSVGLAIAIQTLALLLLPLSSRADSRMRDIGESSPPRWLKTAHAQDAAEMDLVIHA